MAQPLNAAEASEDIYALLRRIELQQPQQGKSLQQQNVDRLLGRSTPRGAANDLDQGQLETRGPHAWFEELIARTPEVPGTFRVLGAARAIEAGVFAEERLRQGVRSEANAEELKWIADHGASEFRFLVEGNLRLVFHWARRQERSLGEHYLQDAFQAGCIGLIRGIRGWDHRRGYALSTYVSWHIRQAIQRWRHDETAVIRLPVHVWEHLRADDGELSPATLAAATRALAIDDYDNLDPESPEFVWDGAIDQAFVAIARYELCRDILWSLTNREAAVLCLRHGLGADGQTHTLGEIGEILGVTRERIRQIESKALMTLRDKFAEDAAEGLY